jgi:putative hydrolase of the HAD superfamily
MAERRCILFDFGGTLDADGVPWGARFFAAHRRAGGLCDAAEFDALFRRSDAMLLGTHPVRGLGLRAMIDQQAAILASLLPGADPAHAGRVAGQVHRDAVAIVRRNRPMLERLARALPLGIVSNFTGNLHECLAELDLLPLFSVVVDSAIVGVSKPDRAIFARALAALDATAGRPAWLVGDNPECDVRPGSELGMTTCWLAPPGRATPAGLRPTHRIGSLLELEGLIR